MCGHVFTDLRPFRVLLGEVLVKLRHLQLDGSVLGSEEQGPFLLQNKTTRHEARASNKGAVPTQRPSLLK